MVDFWSAALLAGAQPEGGGWTAESLESWRESLGEGFHPWLYPLYHLHADGLALWRRLSRGASAVLTPIAAHTPLLLPVGMLAGMLDVLGHAETTHSRPAFGITETFVEGEPVTVIEEEVRRTPFASLLHFRKELRLDQPRVLLVAPMSGHFSTLLRNTVETLLPEHDVFITDWINARDVPVSEGRFGFSSFVDHLVDFLTAMGPGAHVIAVCQPAVPALVATAAMAEDGHFATPRTLTLMAGPIDTRINPTRVNDFAKSRPLSWFEHNLIARVPWRHRGAGRRVYPGFVQLLSFILMNLDRHIAAHWRQWRNIALGDLAAAEAHRRFYSEYLAVMDLTAEFYLETLHIVFQEHLLPRRLLSWHGSPIDLRAIRETTLLVVEAERDDICGVGQTKAALELCSGLPESKRLYHLQPGIGHYGVFSGKRWRQEIFPRIRDVIAGREG
jgi:poly(3-hydroxybutyrate) depolymerase